MMPSSNHRHYSRFIPSEEVGAVTQWKFGAVDGSDLLPPEPEPEPVALPEEPVFDEAAQLALVQQACDDAYAKGFAQGQAETALEWQRRMDDYVAQQGQELAQSLLSVSRSMESSMAGMQQQMAQDVLALACDIARQVVRQELSCNPHVDCRRSPCRGAAQSCRLGCSSAALASYDRKRLRSVAPRCRSSIGRLLG